MSTKVRAGAETAVHVDLAQLVTQIRQTGRAQIPDRDGIGPLVVLPLADYEQLLESVDVALGLLEGVEDIAAGRVVDDAEAQQFLIDAINGAAQTPRDKRWSA